MLFMLCSISFIVVFSVFNFGELREILVHRLIWPIYNYVYDILNAMELNLTEIEEKKLATCWCQFGESFRGFASEHR